MPATIDFPKDSLYVQINMKTFWKDRKDYGTIIVAVFGTMMFLLCLLYAISLYGAQIRELFEVLGRHDEEEFEAYVRAGGILKGMIVIGAAVFIQVISIVIPGMIIQVAAGVVYGWWQAFLICYMSFVAANILVFLAVRRFSRSALLRSFTISPRLMNRLNDNDPIFTIAVCYLVPGVPNGIVPHVAGHSGLTLKQFIIAVSSTVWIQILINCSIGYFLIRGQFIYMFLSIAAQFGLIYIVNTNKEAVMELFERVFHIR